jgi:hypothetical protein
VAAQLDSAKLQRSPRQRKIARTGPRQHCMLCNFTKRTPLPFLILDELEEANSGSSFYHAEDGGRGFVRGEDGDGEDGGGA